MIGPGDTAAIVLAAGESRRFGSNKLLHPRRGRPLAAAIAATLASMPFGQRIAVCSNADVAELFARFGFDVVLNVRPADGQSASLRLAVAALGPATAALICLADMPDVSARHLRRLLAIYDGDVLASTAATYRGPPVLLPAATLRAAPLAGDRGLRSILGGARLLAADEEELHDVDTPADLRA